MWHGTGRVGCASLLDPRGDLVRAIERLGHASSAVERCLPIRLDHAEGVEHSGDLRAVVECAQRSRDALEHRRLAHPLQRGNRSLDEAGDEPSLRLDERDDLGADPERGGCLGRGELDGPVDPEQVRVLSRDPQHEVLAVDLDLQVVIRDAAAEHLEARTPAGPDALDLGRERHARIRSPLGSKSGSSATTPATHSPKISTATSVPTPCSAGRYAYAIDFSTV